MWCCIKSEQGMPEGTPDTWNSQHVKQWFDYKHFKYESKLKQTDGKRLLAISEAELGRQLGSEQRARVIKYELNQLVDLEHSTAAEPATAEAAEAISPAIATEPAVSQNLQPDSPQKTESSMDGQGGLPNPFCKGDSPNQVLPISIQAKEAGA